MAFNKVLVADQVVTKLIEGQGIYQAVNRSFDGLVRVGASSVDVPALAIPKVKTAGVSSTDADRKKSKTDTSMVNIPLAVSAVPLAEEILSQYETNGAMVKEYLASAALALQESFDTAVLTAAMTTTDKTAMSGNVLAWEDITAINAKFDQNKVPKSGRIICISANIAQEFYSIDIVKNAMAFNQQFLTTGNLVSIMGMKFFISGLVPQYTTKDAIVGMYGPGLAFILSRFGEVKDVWDTVNLQTNYDVLAYSGTKLFDNKFAVVKYKN